MCVYVYVYVCTVAVHTDSWLLSVVFFHAAKLTRAEKRKLFDMCTQLPSLYETITGKANIVYGPKNKPGMKRPGGKVGAVAAAKGEKANLPKKTKKEDEEETEPGVHSSPAPGAKKLTNTDQQLLANLKGRHVQLYWPDDNLWYDAEVLDFNSRNKSAKYVSLFPISNSPFSFLLWCSWGTMMTDQLANQLTDSPETISHQCIPVVCMRALGNERALSLPSPGSNTRRAISSS